MKYNGLPTSFRLLILLVLAIPILAVFHDLASPIAGFFAALILGFAATAPGPEMIAITRQSSALAPVLLFPALWMILQLIPLPPFTLSNPIWSLAASALNEPTGSSPVSIAPGRTLDGLFAWLSLAALFLGGLVVGRSREWAAACFFALGVATTLVSVESLLSGADILLNGPGSAFAAAAIGALVNFGVVVDVLRRVAKRKTERSSIPDWIKLMLGALGTVLCTASLLKPGQPGGVIIALSGLVTMLFIAGARRLGVSPRLSLGIYAVVAAAALVFLLLPRWESLSISGLAVSSDLDAIAATQRAIAGSPMLGSGVGSFGSIIKIYQDMRPAPVMPISTATSIMVEWGRPALLILVALATYLFALLFLGAIRRGRDWLYASTAAASLIIVTGEAVLDPGLLTTANQILLVVVLSVGIAQSVSQRLSVE